MGIRIRGSTMPNSAVIVFENRFSTTFVDGAHAADLTDCFVEDQHDAGGL